MIPRDWHRELKMITLARLPGVAAMSARCVQPMREIASWRDVDEI
jgi:hypothetical protein